jgi:hypothetical protein
VSNARNESAFQWTDKTSRAAVGLAEGKTQKRVAEEAGINDRTLRRWLEHPEFAEEVDRLSLMVATAGRAYRLRIVNRVIRQMVEDDEEIKTEKDVLEWLKFAQSETDGSKSDIPDRIAALIAADTNPR